MKFLRLTFPNGQPLALNPSRIESVQPKQIIPQGDFIVGKSKAYEGSLVQTTGGSNYIVQETVDSIVSATTRALAPDTSI